MAKSATGSKRGLSNSKEQLLSALNLSDTENDDDRKWRSGNDSKNVRKMEHNDPAILSYGGFSQRFVASQETVASSHELSKKDRTDSPNLSTSEPDVRSILRYSRESLLTLRDSELSQRKPEQLGRAWIRIGISRDERESRGGDGNESNYSSNTSLTNASSSSYLLPSFACKRRITVNSTEIKRNSAITPKKEDPSNSSASSLNRRSISNSRNSNSTEDEDARSGDRNMFIRRQNEYRNANDGRRIGSGRIPVRELWDEPKYTKLGANEFAPKSGGETSPTNSSAAASTATTTTTTSTASAASTTTTSTANKTEPSKPSDNSNDFNLRPGGGLLGLRDRQRESEQQQSQSSIVTQSHPHLSRTILGNNSILDKDIRSDFRERSVLGDDRYDRNDRLDRSDRLDRGDRLDRSDRLDRNDRLERNERLDRNDRLDRIERLDRNDRLDRGDRNDRADRNDRRPFNRDRDFGRYNDDVMPRNSMSRYNHGDRMNSYSQYNFNSNENRNRRQYNDRNEEPEWFSGGPTSQNDTIELRGFDDSGQRDSPTSHDNDDGDAEEENATAGYESDTDKAEEGVKANDTNNNDKSGNDEANCRDTDSDKHNDLDPEDIEVANSDPKNKKDDNFNFEDFLKMDSLTELLSGTDVFNEAGSGESRFSRWFRPTSDEAKPNVMLLEKVGDHSENGEKMMFGDAGNMNDAAANPNTFMEFLQRGKFVGNAMKQAGPPHGMSTPQMMENNNMQAEFQQQQMVHPSMMANHGPLSVEELEARLRQSRPSSNNSSNMPNDTNLKNSQQDMIAFKKLLQQISGDQQPSPPQQHQPKMLPFGPVPSNNQAQNQQPRQLMPHPESVKKMLIPNAPGPLVSPQQRMEILKRPETQVLIQRLSSGDLSQAFIIQQLNNPSVNQRDREVLFTVLSHVLAPPQPENNMPHPVMPNNIPVPNANLPPNMQAPNNADMIRQLYLQAAVAGPKPQLRISPLPNGIPQRIPSPRELQFHTQTIMQNALIKKKLEEQRENFRKRQDQHVHINPNLAGSNGMIDNMHDNSMNNVQMNRGVSPNSSAALKQLGQNQHTSSPTPTLAFTPTSVLRKMTAEKEMDSGSIVNMNNKDVNKMQQQQMQIQQQQIQQQQQQQHNLFRMQPNIPIQGMQGMQGMPMQGIQAMQGMGMQGLQQNKFLPIQNNNSQQVLAQQKGRPIVKGNGVSNQFATNEFPQAFMMGANSNSNRPPQFNQIDQQRQQQFQFQQAQQAQQFLMMQQHQQMMGGPQMMVHNEMQQQQRSNGDGTLSPISNQLARWFSPELLAQASAGKLPLLDATQALSLEEFERNMHSSTTVNN